MGQPTNAVAGQAEGVHTDGGSFARGAASVLRPFALVTLRIMLVATLGGLAVGALAGTLVFPLLGTLIGAVACALAGFQVGIATVVVAAFMAPRRLQPTAWIARLLFLLPTIGAAIILPVSLGSDIFDLMAGTVDSGSDQNPYLPFLLLSAAVVALVPPLVMACAASWCLSPTMPGLRQYRAPM